MFCVRSYVNILPICLFFSVTRQLNKHIIPTLTPFNITVGGDSCQQPISFHSTLLPMIHFLQIIKLYGGMAADRKKKRKEII